MSGEKYDIIVIGGGHAGAEAAWAAARLGARTALVTHDRAALGRMSCNPAIGGLGKGQLVREIDALGGLMGRVSDAAGIQFRMLNRRKGPAVWSPRAQADSRLYTRVLARFLNECPHLTIIEGGAEALISTAAEPGKRRRVASVGLHEGSTIHAGAVVLAAGTFLRGRMHTGSEKTRGGRIGEAAAENLSTSLRECGLSLGRLKTGTPPRVARDSVQVDKLAKQTGDHEPYPFSFLTRRIDQPQICCWLTETNPEIHALIHANLDRAPLYTGQIESTGPRYCPSIETKIVRFPEKTHHQVFLEPEGLDSDRLYVNGISTSLPRDVQEKMVRLLPGLERAQIVQWGYAIEYDFILPEQMDATLMTRAVPGLFLAGQITGTSGYEEAGAQGVLAGINAVRFLGGQERIVIGRDQGYVGVMIDDLVTRGVTEPYRMFTSRAEHRLHLRYDNADERLTPMGRELGLVDDERWTCFETRRERVQALRAAWDRLRHHGRPLTDWLKRPDEDGRDLLSAHPGLADFATDRDVWERALVEVKYAGYLARQARTIARFRAMEDQAIPAELDYGQIPHLRHEARERWQAVRPRSLGQAARVSGIHSADISVLMVYLASLGRRPTAKR